MTFKERLKGVGIGLVIVIGCIPMVAVLTISTASFWSWFEATFAVESYGHSGPAEWCYLAFYLLILVICTFVWSFVRIKSSRKKS